MKKLKNATLNPRTQQSLKVSFDSDVHYRVGKRAGHEEEREDGIRNSAEIYFELLPEIDYDDLFLKLLKKYPDNAEMIKDVLDEFF